MLSTNTNPFAEWNHASLEGVPSSVLGALPTIAACSSLPVFISDSLVLHFAQDVLNCSVCVNDRPLFIVSSDAQTITFHTSDNQPFAIVRLEPTAHVEITGHTLKQRVGDWLRLSPDHSCRHMSVGRVNCVWTAVQQHIALLAEDGSMLARITGTPSTTALEVTRLGIQLNLLHPCIVAATLFLSGRHID